MHESGAVGHRATVTFDLLGVPGPTTVALYYDIGAHWGGVTSRAPMELAGWALLGATMVVAVLAGVVGLGIRSSGTHARRSCPGASTNRRRRRQVRDRVPGSVHEVTVQDHRSR